MFGVWDPGLRICFPFFWGDAWLAMRGIFVVHVLRSGDWNTSLVWDGFVFQDLGLRDGDYARVG